MHGNNAVDPDRFAHCGTRSFTGVGSTALETAFSVRLNCAVPGSQIYITLTDNANPANTSNTLSLKSDSTASGLGFQVLNKGIPVSFGPDSSVAGNTNQWQVGVASTGSINIPLSVRYIQTPAQVRPGTVDAVPTFTMSYQ
ncbi:fimbrial protein [Paraburkholderia sp. BL23I1N1]|uniref:fimbrial protein n=1 Tax=Paraburkholderia sp. BL23I1N1 TaxID=1938802 RepID=UPI000E745BC6|nr:fimbrial protein [Paraburkholderia sp. BL23I1N1]